MATKAVIGLISLYQRTLSPDHGWLKVFYPAGVCRYQPTCSEYTKQAVGRFGAVRGLALGLKRVGRCHPWGGSGFDPIPEKR